MTRLVADASAIVDLLAGAPSAPKIRAIFAEHAEIYVPEHFHVEVLSALRGLLRRGDLDPVRAARALELATELRVVRHAVLPLSHEVWAMRERLTAYDAAYLAVARAVDASLLTTDRALAQAARRDGRLVTGPGLSSW